MIYYANLLLLLIMNFAFPISKKSKKIFCFIATLSWIIISGLRGLSVGADTYRYASMFENVMQTSWVEILSNLKYYLSSGATKDPGYDLFVKICQIFVSDYQVYLIIVAFIIFVPMGMWVYKYSSDPFISFVMFSGLFYSFIAITGIRQSIVMSIVIFIGYDLIVKKKTIPFIVMVLIAASIHKVALLALAFLIIQKLKVTNFRMLIMIITSAILFLFKNSYTQVASSILGFENYAIQQEGTNPITFTVLYVVLVAMTIMYAYKNNNLDTESSMQIYAVLVGLMFLPMLFVNQSTMRGLQMFSIFMMLLIPKLFDRIFNKKSQWLARMLLFTVIFVLVYRNNPHYDFFW